MDKQLKPGKFLKSRMVDEYTQRLKDSQSLIVTNFGGLTNKEFEDLKRQMKPTSNEYFVIKNSLCKLALKNLKLDNLADMVDGACALSYGSGDAVSVSKALAGYAKSNEKFKLLGGYVDGEIVTADDILELAQLPGREVLLARLVGAINSPITGLVGVFSGVIKKLLYAIKEIANKKESNKEE